jgi:hypothetical protein
MKGETPKLDPEGPRTTNFSCSTMKHSSRGSRTDGIWHRLRHEHKSCNYRCCKPRLTSTSHFYALRATPKTALNFGWLVGWSVGWSRGSHMNVTLPLQFCHQGPPSRPFYALRATPKTALNFDRSVGQSQGSHTNITLPLQFCHPCPPFPTLRRPAGHPQNGLKFWLVGRSRGNHTNVTLPLQFCHLGLPFPTLLRPAGHPQNSFKFWLVGWLVGPSVGRSRGNHTSQASPSRPFYALRATPKTAFNFGWLVGRLVGWLVGRLVDRSQGSHMNVTLPLQFCHLPNPSTPCRPPPKRP